MRSGPGLHCRAHHELSTNRGRKKRLVRERVVERTTSVAAVSIMSTMVSTRMIRIPYMLYSETQAHSGTSEVRGRCAAGLINQAGVTMSMLGGGIRNDSEDECA